MNQVRPIVGATSDPLKILMIDSLVSNEYTFWLCEALASANTEVEFITVQNHKDKEITSYKLLPVSPLKGENLGNKYLKTLQYLYFLMWVFFYILRTRPDVVHFQFFRRERIESLYYPLLRLMTGKLVFTAHDLVPLDQDGKLDRFLRTLVYKTSTKLIVHVNSLKEGLVEQFNIAPDKIYVVPHPHPPHEETHGEIAKDVARQKLNIADDDQVLLYFGSIRDYKGLDILFDAFDLAKPSLPKLKLIVAGRPHSKALNEQYTEYLERLQYKDSIVCRFDFIPSEEIDYYFGAADAMAMPYRTIFYSGVLHTAFSYKLPILATNVGSFSDLIDPGINGYITEPGDPAKFAEIIIKAFEDFPSLARMGEQSYKTYQNLPNWKEIGQLTVDVYQQ